MFCSKGNNDFLHLSFCYLFVEFASWAYPNYQLDFSDVLIDIDPNFNNLGWSIDEVSSYTKVVTYWYVYDYAFGIYDVTISRYSNHYVRTAVLPCLVSSLIVLFGLWVNDIGSRLSLSVTGLLTNIAVQWTVSENLPITNGSVWLSSFLTLSMVFVAVVCLQCFISGYMNYQKKGKPVPIWMKYLIDFSLLRIPHLTEEALDDEIEEDRKLQLKLQQQQQEEQVEMKGGSESNAQCSIPMQVLNPLSGDNSNQSEEGVLEGGREGVFSTGTTAKLKSSNNGGGSSGLYSYTGELLPYMKTQKYTWQRGSRSFDRFCRILIPLLFVMFISIELGTSSN